MGTVRGFARGLVLTGLFAILAGSVAHANLLIVPTYDATVSPQAQAAFGTVVALLGSLYTNNITVSVDVNFSPTACTGGCLGMSNSNIFGYAYTDWQGAMVTDSGANPGNQFLKDGIASSLPASPNPLANSTLNPSDLVWITQANARALGLYPSAGSGADATISFNASQPYEFTGVPTGGAYDFMNVAEHELDEVLGIGSELNSGFPVPGQYMAEDYFRYASAGVRGSATDPTSLAYFSYNGGNTLVAPFNQNPAGDINDWGYGCGTLHVQNAFTCSGVVSTYDANSPEYAVLNTLGFDGTAPEPATWALMGAALAGVALARRKRGA